MQKEWGLMFVVNEMLLKNTLALQHLLILNVFFILERNKIPLEKNNITL